MSSLLDEIAPVTRSYQLEALSDDSRLRVIVWPRFAGKSYFITLDLLKISQFPRSHGLIVHADAGEMYSMRSKWLLTMDPEAYTSITYGYLTRHMEKVIARTRGKNLWIYFEEPDLYPVDDTSASSVVSAMCAIIAMDPKTAIQQITYVGTASNIGRPSKLGAMADLVPLPHTVHPREVWPEDWVSRITELSIALDTPAFRTEVMGAY